MEFAALFADIQDGACFGRRKYGGGKTIGNDFTHGMDALSSYSGLMLAFLFSFALSVMLF